jgi:hypothetical protein
MIINNGRCRRMLLCLATTTGMLIAGSGASEAAQLLFSPDGSPAGTGAVETMLPLQNISSVNLPRGTLILHGDTAQVTMVPEWQFDRRTVLQGRILDTRKTMGQRRGLLAGITGILFFDSGEWINHFDDKSAVESLTTDKDTFAGRISAVSGSDIEMTQLNGQKITVPLSAVQDLRSPRAFRFDIPLSHLIANVDETQRLELDGSKVNLTHLGRTFRLAQLRTASRQASNDGDVSTAKLVALGTTVSLLNMAQLAPLLGIPLGAEPALRRNAFFKQFRFNLPNNQ